MIREALLKASKQEEIKKSFCLSGRGHESRVTLNPSLAGIVMGLDVPCVLIKGVGANQYYSKRVLKRAATALKRKLRFSLIKFSNNEMSAYSADR